MTTLLLPASLLGQRPHMWPTGYLVVPGPPTRWSGCSRWESCVSSEPFELIGGELVAMAPKDRLHEVLRSELWHCCVHQRSRDLKIATGSPLRLGKHDAPEPDLIVFPAA